MFSNNYFTVNKDTKISPFQTMCAYMGGSAFQTVVDNPITAYRQLVQQYAKNLSGKNKDLNFSPPSNKVSSVKNLVT